MPSSISSSSRQLPRARWPLVLGGALLAWIVFLASMEGLLASRGIVPTALDSKASWLRQRVLASRLGERALVLVGSSRMQLDADLDVLRAQTPFEPVQLAIDGSSFVPVLEGLAADPSFHGSVIVDFADANLLPTTEQGLSPAYQKAYETGERGELALNFAAIEGWLTQQWRQRLRSYADATRPMTSLELRILLGAYPQYLATLPDRSRLADFSQTNAALRTLQILRRQGLLLPVASEGGRGDAQIRKAIDAIGVEQASLEPYRLETAALATRVAALHARGARVYFVVPPRSGFLKALEDRRHPRELFWDRFAASIGAPAVHFEDVPAMRGLVCPDGSHLDYRERARFTAALIAAFGLDKRR